MNNTDREAGVIARLEVVLAALRSRPEAPEVGLLLAIDQVASLHAGTAIERVLCEIHREYQICVAK